MRAKFEQKKAGTRKIIPKHQILCLNTIYSVQTIGSLPNRKYFEHEKKQFEQYI